MVMSLLDPNYLSETPRTQVPSGVSFILKHLYSLTPKRNKSCGQSPAATCSSFPAEVRSMPFYRGRLCANLFCSLVVQANPGGPLAAAISPPFSLYKRLLLAYSRVWVVFTLDPVAPALLPAFFCFLEAALTASVCCSQHSRNPLQVRQNFRAKQFF
jgi:hypothetical protein